MIHKTNYTSPTKKNSCAWT